MTKNKTSIVAVIVIVTIVIAFVPFINPVHAISSEKKAKKVVVKYSGAAKKYKWKTMNKCIAKRPKKYGYPTVRCDWIYKKYNKNMRWRILETKKKGKKKYAIKVEIYQPSFYDEMYKAFYDTMVWAWNNDIKSQKKLGNSIINKYNMNVKRTEKEGKVKYITKTFVFDVVKKKGKWKIKKKTRGVVDIATAMMNVAEDDATDAFLEWIQDSYYDSEEDTYDDNESYNEYDNYSESGDYDNY